MNARIAKNSYNLPINMLSFLLIVKSRYLDTPEYLLHGEN
jgi:hypothetical protein